MIYKDGYIDLTNDNNTHYPLEGSNKTRQGYIYLVDKENAAVEFAGKHFLNKYGGHSSNDCIVIIKVHIDDDKIELDPDEYKWDSIYTQNSKFYRINKKIPIDGSISFTILNDLNSWEKICIFTDNHIDNDYRFKWKKIGDNNEFI